MVVEIDQNVGYTDGKARKRRRGDFKMRYDDQIERKIAERRFALLKGSRATIQVLGVVRRVILGGALGAILYRFWLLSRSSSSEPILQLPENRSEE